MADNYLILSDTQIPWHAKRVIPFLKQLQSEFKVPEENVLHVGDECDFLYLSRYPKNPNMRLSAIQEYEEMINTLSEFYVAFPVMRLCYSNHGARLANKALESQIPELYLRDYSELLQAPTTWVWARHWKVNTRHPFIVEHGHKHSGVNAHRNAAMLNGTSTAIGHCHSFAAIDYINTEVVGRMWAFNVGCLIDAESLAFSYGKDQKFQPVLGCGVVLDDGRRPLFIPYEE